MRVSHETLQSGHSSTCMYTLIKKAAPLLIFTLTRFPEFDEIPAVEAEAESLACNCLSPSQIHLRNSFCHHLVVVMDFIFHVDLSTAYIVLRRDFLTSQDANGSLSSPVGAGFYCTQHPNAISILSLVPGIVLTTFQKRRASVTDPSIGQTRPRLPTRRRGHIAPKKPPRIGVS